MEKIKKIHAREILDSRGNPTVDGFTPSPSGTFDTGIMSADDIFEWTPESAGEVPYYCLLHTWMQGTIIVE